MINNETSAIIFLGLCERAVFAQDGNTNVYKWNILGLKPIIQSYIFPLNISSMSIAIAYISSVAGTQQCLKFMDNNGLEIGIIYIRFPDNKEIDFQSSSTVDKYKNITFALLKNIWTPAFLQLSEIDINIIISSPGDYYLSLITNKGPQIIGQIEFSVIEPPPLTPERIAAIKADPEAAKEVQFELGCKKCPSKLRAYAAIDKTQKLEREGLAWYESIPDNFICECGSVNIDLSILRRNLHGVLGQRIRGTLLLNFIPLYEKSSLEKIRANFLHLLNSNPSEESLHKYIYKNPILLHQFPSEKIFSKPSILTLFEADFALVTPQKELLLIELEKTNTRLMKKNGGVAAPLSHAFDQVRDWLHIVDEHRLAVLDSLKIDRELISVVRGVVIAGRDLGYDTQHLRRLKGADWGRITLLTYDDILFALYALIRRMDTL